MGIGTNWRINPRARCRYALSVLALGLVSACGGGGSSSAPGVNRAPTFSSATVASILENSTVLAYQATATDLDGDALTYSIAGGADAGRFAITPAGQLGIAAAPNFDLPADADGNNVYEVQISVSDGKVATSLALAVTVINSKEGVSVRRVATGFAAPAAIATTDDTTILVAEKTGAVYLLNPQTGTKAQLVQIANVGSVGVTAIAASLTFASDGTFYAMYTTATGFLVVNRYLRNPAGSTVPDNFGPILAVSAPQYEGGGWLGFDAAGALLATTGDAGGNGDPSGSAQDDASRLGKIIRITPNPDPFAGATPVFFLLNTIAKGLHQPNGGSRFGDAVLIADRGQTMAEEIDFLAAGSSGQNYGWPFSEGTSAVRGTPPAAVIDPVVQYLRGAGPRAGQAIVGGAIGPSAVASLRNQYVFADGSGAIFTLASASIQQGTILAAAMFERRDADFAPDQGVIDHPVAITASLAGSMYILDADGEIFRVDAG